MNKDETTGNANLMLSLKDEYKSAAKTEFLKLYNAEENLMLEDIKALGIPCNIQLLRAIPWHPFFTKAMLK